MKKRRVWWCLGSLVLLLLAGILLRDSLLWSMGAMLVNSETPQHADLALVLGGDYRGRRLMKASELMMQGYVPRVLVSGAGGMYGFHESELAIEYAVKRGFPRERYVATQHPAVSTQDEIRNLVATLHELGAHKILLVTSPSHTARATRVFRSEVPDIEVHPVAAEDPTWQGGYWWRTREGEKNWLFEAMKNVAYTFGI